MSMHARSAHASEHISSECDSGKISSELVAMREFNKLRARKRENLSCYIRMSQRNLSEMKITKTLTHTPQFIGK